MDVTEQAEVQGTVEESLPIPAAQDSPVEEVAVDPAGANRPWFRLAYAFEFWLALIAIFVVWSEVGGQGHLDLVAWYIKLPCALALAWSGVRMTGALVENPRAWNRSMVRWLVAVLVLSGLVIGITYWYHLHEAPDEPDTDENSATSVTNRPMGHALQRDRIST